MAVTQSPSPMANAAGSGVGAAIDIGSYSVHLLVAEIGPDELRVRHDESAFLNLGRTIDDEGRLGSARRELVDTIARFAEQARASGAASITVVGTDPLRRAVDGEQAIAEISKATGHAVTLLSHQEEASLALIGVQEGRVLTRRTVMVDVGGGSTEILLVGPDRPPVAVGLPLGAARLTGMHVANDPPTPAELAALDSEVTATMALAPRFAAEQLVAVGGTARSLLRIGPPVGNRVLTERRIREALELIGVASAETIAERHGVRLSRARVLAAGATILGSALEAYALDRLRVASGGLREGLILAVEQAGAAWLGELPRLARGWLD